MNQEDRLDAVLACEEQDMGRADNSVINALKRLERAGSERSKTMQKLTEAADRLAEHIEETLADVVGPKGAVLPRDYIIGAATGELAYGQLLDDWRAARYLGHGNATRASALHFAHDIATGWLDELAEWVEAQGKDSAEAVANLRQAAKGMEE